MRKCCEPSPSNDSTASTMCSTTRGPAIWPSLVTCPTRMIAAPDFLANRISACAEARTCVTVPGADSTVSVHMVWIEIDHDQARHRALRQRRDDVLDRGFGGELHRRIRQPQPLGAQPHLRHGFFAGYVNHAMAGAGHQAGGLRQQGRLADAGIAADQQHRAAHKSAAGDAIEFAHAGGQPRSVLGLAGQRFQLERPAPALRADRYRHAPVVSSSASVFHSPQDSHLPCQRLYAAPQFWQTKERVDLAMEGVSRLLEFAGRAHIMT